MLKIIDKTKEIDMVIVLARAKINPGMTDDFVNVAQRLVAASRTEPGCISYELLKEERDNAYAFLEHYHDHDAAISHRKTEHVRTLGRQLGEFLEGRPEVITFTSAIEGLDG
jgi:quinol monooxygenase YgiN